MDTKQLEYVLDELHFTEALPREVVEQLAAESNMVQLTCGTILFREGSANDNLYLVRSGRLGVEMNVPGRGAVRILTLGPGEMIGWSSLLDQGQVTATTVAVEDSQLVYASASSLRRVSEANHHFGYHLMRQMASALSKRLVATRLQLLDLFADNPPPVPTARQEGSG